MPKRLVKSLLGLFSLVSMAADYTCPAMNVSADCLEGQWKSAITMPDTKWTLSGETIEKSACEGKQHANQVGWNYAVEFVRMGSVFCSYSLLDTSGAEIGMVQIKSFAYSRSGSEWMNGGYPGYYKCSAGMDKCLLRSKS